MLQMIPAHSPRADSLLMVNIFPGRERVGISRAAAVHLYRLIQRYNGCLRDTRHYALRWMGFWPQLTRLERTVLALCIRANTGCAPGRRLQILAAPVFLEPLENNCQPQPLAPAVEVEFRRVLSAYYQTLVTADEIQHSWISNCPKEAGVLRALDLVDPLLVECGIDAERIELRCAALLIARGWSFADARAIASRLGADVDGLLTKRELQC